MSASGGARSAFDVVVIGTSAGGLQALTTVLGRLPVSFPVGVAVAMHLSPDHASALPEILARRTAIEVRWARSGDRLAPGLIVIAPPDRHLLIARGGWLVLAATPRVRFSRPSVDRLFEAAAAAYGPRALGVVLTGSGSDGAAGAATMHRAGGTVIAQDQASSEFFAMPGAAIRGGGASIVLPLGEIPAALCELVATGVRAPA